MLIDAFTFYNEFDLLELRLNILNDIVDRFVLVEGNKTFSNVEKALHFSQDRSGRFDRFKHKIMVVTVDDWPVCETPWGYETFQRDSILHGLSDCSDNDIIIISDLDEIPNPEVIKEYTPEMGISALEQDFFYYCFNNKNIGSSQWRRAKIMSYKDLCHGLDEIDYVTPYNPFPVIGKTTPTKIRLYSPKRKLKNGGWHFSYLMSLEGIADKIKVFSHQEFNTPEFTDVESIRRRIQQGRDLFDRSGAIFCAVPLDSRFPRYLLENKEKYMQYILPYSPFRYYSRKAIVFFRSILYAIPRTVERLGRSIKKRI